MLLLLVLMIAGVATSGVLNGAGKENGVEALRLAALQVSAIPITLHVEEIVHIATLS